jgi:hypothetical protein
LMLLAGCSTTEPGKEVGPYVPAVYDKPACSQVTLSKVNGKGRVQECDVR